MRNTLPFVLLGLALLLLMRRKAAASPALDDARHIVQAGESLWSIAKAGLPAGSSNAQVLAYVRSIAKANGMNLQLMDGRPSAAAGDPDTIYPGQVLIIPTFGA